MFFGGEKYSKDCDAQEGHDVRLVASYFSFQPGEVSSILNRIENIDPGGAAADNISQSELPFRQASILPIGQRLADQFRLIQKLPKAI